MNATGLRKIFQLYISPIIGVLLVIVLFQSIDWASYIQKLQSVHWLYVTAIFGLSWLHLLLTAIKWQVVTRFLFPGIHGHIQFYRYSVYGAGAAMALPVGLGAAGVRGLSAGVDSKDKIAASMGSVVYDYMFDFSIYLCFFVGWLLWTSQKLALDSVSWLTAGLLVASCVALIVFFRYFPDVINSLVHRFYQKTSDLPQPRSIPAKACLYLFCLSLVRFGVLVLRAAAVVWALDLTITFEQVAFAQSVTQMAGLAAISPGGLGIVEWGWIGGLAALGVGKAIAAELVISHRVLVTISVLLLLLPLAIYKKKPVHLLR